MSGRHSRTGAGARPRPGRFSVPENDETAWPEAGRPEPARVEPAQAGARPEPAQAERAQAEQAQAGPAQDGSAGPAATAGPSEGQYSQGQPAQDQSAPDQPIYSGTAPVDAVARRTPTGWRVGDEEVPDLTSAMVLADILAAELSSAEQSGLDSGSAVLEPVVARAERPPAAPRPGAGRTGNQPAASQPAASRAGATGPSPIEPAEAQRLETEQLKETVAQLEHALTVRVRVEQAIGVLAERHRLRPRQAFELLRSASRARGQRIMVTASQVIASASNPLLRLPEELAKPPMPRRLPRRSRSEA